MSIELITFICNYLPFVIVSMWAVWLFLAGFDIWRLLHDDDYDGEKR